jgi:hypothetical protein
MRSLSTAGEIRSGRVLKSGKRIKFEWDFPDFKGERWRSYTEFLPPPPHFVQNQTFSTR